jgi:ribosomal protein L18
MARRFVLRVYVAAKHMTANVVDWNERRVVASASTVEKSISDAFELGKNCNAKAAASVGEVLAMRLKTEEPGIGLGGGVHMDVEKEIEKKSVDTGPEVWAVVDALRKRGVKVFVHNEHGVVGSRS